MYGDAFHPLLEDCAKEHDLTTVEGCLRYINYLSLRICMAELSGDQWERAIQKSVEEITGEANPPAIGE